MQRECSVLYQQYQTVFRAKPLLVHITIGVHTLQKFEEVAIGGQDKR